MPNSWLNDTLDLANVFPLRTSNEPSNALPVIVQPIDLGALQLLSPYQNPTSFSSLNPLEVERLTDELREILARCDSLKQRAQEIETIASVTAIDYRMGIDLLKAEGEFEQRKQSWPRLVDSSTLSTSNGTTVGHGDYATVENTYREAAIRAQQRRLESMKARAEDTGNGTALVERFQQIKLLFERYLVSAYKRCVGLSHGLKLVYGINKPVPVVRDVGYLSSLELWFQEVSEELDRALDRRQLGILGLGITNSRSTVGLNEHCLIPRADWLREIASNSVSFSIDKSVFDHHRMYNPVLRGLSLQLYHDDWKLPSLAWVWESRYWNAEVVLPRQGTFGGSAITPSMRLVCGFTRREPDSVPQGHRRLHNSSPIGNWKLTLSSTDLAGDANTPMAISNILLSLRISYESA